METVKKTISEELKALINDYYILLKKSLLGEKFDVIRCVSTREYRTDIIRADGSPHWFASDIKYGIDNKWFIPFSHTEFARLHVTEALQEASEKVTCDAFFEEYNEDNLKLDMDDNYEATFVFPLLTGGRVFDVNKSSIINSYPLENIK